MTIPHIIDATLAVVIAFAMIFLVHVYGDPLYFGLWYYFVVPIFILGVCAAFRAAPLFLFGASSAIALSMLAVMSINWQASRPVGLLGLGHVFSLPGAVIGVIAATFISRKLIVTNPFSAFMLGFAGFGIGYFLNQLLVCNTVMWCGPLSLLIK